VKWLNNKKNKRERNALFVAVVSLAFQNIDGKWTLATQTNYRKYRFRLYCKLKNIDIVSVYKTDIDPSLARTQPRRERRRV